jgi:hypothetical protein
MSRDDATETGVLVAELRRHADAIEVDRDAWHTLQRGVRRRTRVNKISAVALVAVVALLAVPITGVAERVSRDRADPDEITSSVDLWPAQTAIWPVIVSGPDYATRTPSETAKEFARFHLGFGADPSLQVVARSESQALIELTRSDGSPGLRLRLGLAFKDGPWQITDVESRDLAIVSPARDSEVRPGTRVSGTAPAHVAKVWVYVEDRWGGFGREAPVVKGRWSILLPDVAYWGPRGILRGPISVTVRPLEPIYLDVAVTTLNLVR